jgi:YtkA-like
VHLRVAPSNGGSCLKFPRRDRSRRAPSILLVLTVCLIVAACIQPAQARDLKFEWTLTPAPVSVGTARLQLRVLDAAGRPVRGAQLQIEAQMAHPGMMPLVVVATERSEGLYEAELQFSMGGDWILVVEGSLSNGARVHHRIDVPNVRSR